MFFLKNYCTQTIYFSGVPDEREGLFDTIQRSKSHYQKRAYQCIKCLVALFTECRPALQLLHSNAEFKQKWTLAIEWLQDELERVMFYNFNFITIVYFLFLDECRIVCFLSMN